MEVILPQLLLRCGKAGEFGQRVTLMVTDEPSAWATLAIVALLSCQSSSFRKLVHNGMLRGAPEKRPPTRNRR